MKLAMKTRPATVRCRPSGPTACGLAATSPPQSATSALGHRAAPARIRALICCWRGSNSAVVSQIT